MSLPVVTNPLNINLKFLEKPAKRNIQNNIRRSNLNKLIFSHLNINSIRNKFQSVVKDISSNVDYLCYLRQKLMIVSQKVSF